MTMHVHADPETHTVSVTTVQGWSDFLFTDDGYRYTQGTHNLCALRDEDPAAVYGSKDFRVRLELLEMVSPDYV